MITIFSWLLCIGAASFIAFALAFLWMSLLTDGLPDEHGPMGYWFVCTMTVLALGATGFFFYCTFQGPV